MSEQPVVAIPRRHPEVTLLAVWGARLAWLLVAVVGGGAVGEAVSDHPSPAPAVLTVLAWLGWSVGALALTVPSVPTLTIARVTVPGALVVAVGASLGGASGGASIGLAVPALVAAILAGTAETARMWVQASAYGDEQRFPLRPPLGYLSAAVGAWGLWATATVVAVVAWTDARPVLAAGATALSVGGLAVLPRRWHQLSRRWLVFVPAGLVVHDPVLLADTLMVARAGLAHIGLRRGVAPPAHGAADLTGPTPGAALVIVLREQAVVALAAGGRSSSRRRSVEAPAVVVAPSRPGAALAEARRRRLAVG